MITIPKQDKTTVSVNSEGVILIEQEDQFGESQSISISQEMAGMLIEAIRSVQLEAEYHARKAKA
jgi:hypothetical protein